MNDKIMKRKPFIIGFLFPLLTFGACTKDTTQGSGNNQTGDIEKTGSSEGGVSRSTNDGGGINAETPFSGNQDQIKKIMATISGVKPDMTLSNQQGSTLNWKGGRFDGLPVDQWGFRFFRDQMLYAQLHYTTETTRLSVDDLYDSLTVAMNQRYGLMIMDSKNIVSKALIGYSEEEQKFISRVGSSLAATEFRMWTSGDSSANYIATIYRAPRKSTNEAMDVYVTWYDRMQSEAYDKMIQSYSE